MTDEVVSTGREAWHRLRARERKDWHDWLAVGRALEVGKTVSMAISKTNRMVGSRYNSAMGLWLNENDLADINAQERYRIGQILKNLPAIGTWRNGLTDEQRRKLNHPGAVWHAWRRSLKPAAQSVAKPPDISPQEAIRRVAEAARSGRPVYWSQDAVRRAHRAMLDSRSTDLLTLARSALQAAIRSEADLLELLADPSSRRRHTERAPEPEHAAA